MALVDSWFVRVAHCGSAAAHLRHSPIAPFVDVAAAVVASSLVMVAQAVEAVASQSLAASGSGPCDGPTSVVGLDPSELDPFDPFDPLDPLVGFESGIAAVECLPDSGESGKCLIIFDVVLLHTLPTVVFSVAGYKL